MKEAPGRQGERTAGCRAWTGGRPRAGPRADDGGTPLRDLLWTLLHNQFGAQVALNGHPAQRLPNTLNVSFVGRVGSDILGKMEGVAASTGSACHAGKVELSPVLRAMGVSQKSAWAPYA